MSFYHGTRCECYHEKLFVFGNWIVANDNDITVSKQENQQSHLSWMRLR